MIANTGYFADPDGHLWEGAWMIRSAGLDGRFEHVLSTDGIKTYKPDPRSLVSRADQRLP